MSAKQIAFGQRLWQLCISSMLYTYKTHAHTHEQPQNKLKARKRFNLFHARVFKTNILWPFSYLLSFRCNGGKGVLGDSTFSYDMRVRWHTLTIPSRTCASTHTWCFNKFFEFLFSVCTLHAFHIQFVFYVLAVDSFFCARRICGVCLADQIELNQNGNEHEKKKAPNTVYKHTLRWWTRKIKTKLSDSHENSFPVDRLKNIVRNKRFALLIVAAIAVFVSIEMCRFFQIVSFLVYACMRVCCRCVDSVYILWTRGHAYDCHF